MKIKFEIIERWDHREYIITCLTQCPHLIDSNTKNGILVGSFNCQHCKYYDSQNNQEQFVNCNYKEEINGS